MKKVSLSYFVIGIALYTLSGCSSKHAEKADYTWLKYAIETSAAQLEYTVSEIGDSVLLPRSIWTGYDVNFLCQQLEKKQLIGKDSARLKPIHDNLGSRRYCFSIYDWTSGFFPGNLWYAYQLTGNEEFKKEAVKFTNYLYPLREYKGTHDIGFMMNLDLLFYGSHLTGDDKYKELALKHAETTMKNHFRDDYSSYHVVSYNNDGTVEKKCTHQGQKDDSSWARGQAWGLYGYTSCYRESKNAEFLRQAENIAALIMRRVKTEDAIPLWDYDAPDMPQTPRDASAASITASALIELSTLVEDGQIYFDYAERLLKNLSSEAYLAKVGTNQGFILMHSTGSLPNGSEIDTPINYADYYYLEALLRYMKVKGLNYKNI